LKSSFERPLAGKFCLSLEANLDCFSSFRLKSFSNFSVKKLSAVMITTESQGENQMDTSIETNNDYSFSEICSDDYLKCALCGQDLQFTHKIDYMTLKVKEEAQCPCCNIKLKVRDYSIQ
jgi:hypothetical protein